MRLLTLGAFLLLSISIIAQNLTVFPQGLPGIPHPQIPAANYSTVSYVDPRTGIRQNITYRTTNTGNVIYQDDINWGPESLLLEWAANHTVYVPHKTRGFGVKSNWAWPDATIVYRYDSCETRELLKGIFDASIAIWKKGAPFLTFKELAPAAYTGTASGILTITKDDTKNPWCYSNVAWDRGIPPTGLRMNLQWLDPFGGPSCGQASNAVLHEQGHAIGLMHEQSRPDRDNFITVDCSKYAPWTLKPGTCPLPAYPACCGGGIGATDECCADWHNYDADTSSIYNTYGPYDCKSIMHYGASDVLHSTAQCTIDPSLTPTQGDYDAVCQIYSSFCAPWKALDNCAPKPAACGTCNPTSGLNKCDITSTCISTGSKFHCACRAGYKAAAGNNDVSKQFRLPWDGYKHLVFVTEGTVCNTLCDNPFGFSDKLCAEVGMQNMCPL
ncbi:hypothetical protein BGZ60DRAFT_430549 [Tricladium varicosporioides]|nr:hypothetical protein BGZ60DRAFT_430549 [Hymenoscyphus varicosporioides]